MRTYFVIGSFYGGPRLHALMTRMREVQLDNFAILVNEQVAKEMLGFAYIYNRLVACALSDPQCEYVWIMGDDGIPQGDCIEQVQRVMEANPDVGAMLPVAAWNNPEGKLVSIHPVTQKELPLAEALAVEPDLVDQIFSGFSCVCISRAAWEATGPMDESLGRGYAEDLDWGVRAWRAGYRMVNYQRAWFMHECSATFSRMVAEGVFGKEEGHEAATRCQAKWPWLWREPPSDSVERLRRWYREARAGMKQ